MIESDLISTESILKNHPNVLYSKEANIIGSHIEKQKEIIILPVYKELTGDEIEFIANQYNIKNYQVIKKQQLSAGTGETDQFDCFIYIIKY
ncbi:hypothetical protein [Mesoflavibacter zeaxanthinifaciens]|uniref:hypothetical protein n=1 Tax=Mesoflavibacter zeaxanthinifaciens TaxID=393060 RepID=UPI0004007421|nr:hypothetical protein [Mesoflavibacter zeaxanthinifaciens]